MSTCLKVTEGWV